MGKFPALLAVVISVTSYGAAFGQAGMNERVEFFRNLADFIQWAMENIKPDESILLRMALSTRYFGSYEAA